MTTERGLQGPSIGSGPRCAGRLGAAAAVLSLLLLLGACDDSPQGPERTQQPFADLECDLDASFLADGGVGRDGIPSLTDPETVQLAADRSNEPDYLRDDDRVVGITVDGQAYAVPHNILWWHEIVNLDIGERELAITLCPLTGSSLGFDRETVDGAELGVSGLLFMNNLVMFDRSGSETESLWPQMMAQARCGSSTGTILEQVAVVEMRWDAWAALHPNTLVPTARTGHARDYREYPYGDYESLDSDQFLLPSAMPSLDRRRPVKERVLGVPPTDLADGIAFPYGALQEAPGRSTVVEFDWEGEAAIVLWSTRAQGAMAYRPRTTGGRDLELRGTDEGFEDVATGSLWTVDGRAVSGELEGARLEPLETAYVAFWGAWAAFFPDTGLWEG